MHNQDYRTLLRRELRRRAEANAGYSLRSYARDLGFDPGRLSRVLNGKQGLSFEVAKKLASHFNLSEFEKKWFLTSVKSTDARSKKEREAAALELESLRLTIQENTLDHDKFSMISGWWHYAILELTSIKGSNSNPSWYAKRLGISTECATDACERLLRLGLVEKKRNRFIQTDIILNTTTDIPSESIRSYHRDLIKKAMIALERQSVKERDFSNLTIALKKSDLPVLKERIKKFRREINELIENGSTKKDREEVYTMSTLLFRLTEGDHP